MQVEQDVNIYVGQVDPGQTIHFNNEDGRQSYAYLLVGQMRVDGFALDAGDALKVRNKEFLCFSAIAESHLLIVEMALG